MNQDLKDVAPPSYQEATQLPTTNPVQPPYPQVNPHPIPQPVPELSSQPQTIIIQQANPAMAQNIVVIQEVKVAPSFDPYLESCQYCHAQMITRRRYVMGSMACLFLFLAIFFPLLIFCICCACFQDAHHYCSNCNRLIAIRRR